MTDLQKQVTTDALIWASLITIWKLPHSWGAWLGEAFLTIFVIFAWIVVTSAWLAATNKKVREAIKDAFADDHSSPRKIYGVLSTCIETSAMYVLGLNALAILYIGAAIMIYAGVNRINRLTQSEENHD